MLYQDSAGQKRRITDRERQVLAGVAGGLTNKSIGRLLGTKEATVRNQLATLFIKLGVQSREEAAEWWGQASDNSKVDKAAEGSGEEGRKEGERTKRETREREEGGRGKT